MHILLNNFRLENVSFSCIKFRNYYSVGSFLEFGIFVSKRMKHHHLMFKKEEEEEEEINPQNFFLILLNIKRVHQLVPTF